VFYTYSIFSLPLQPIEREHDPDMLEALLRLAKPFMLRRLKRDLLHELPPRTEIDQYVGLTAKQVAMYSSVVEDIMGQMQNGGGRGLIFKLLTS